MLPTLFSVPFHGHSHVTSSFMPPRIRDRHWEIVSWLQCFIVQRAEFVFDTPSCMAGLNSCMQLGSVFFSSGWQIIFWNFYMNLDPRTWFRRERGSTLVLMLTRFPQHLFWPTIKKQILSTHEDFFSQITSQVAVGTMSLFPGFSTQNDFKFVVGWWNATFLLCS